MSLYAIVRIPLNASMNTMSLFYIEKIEEVEEYLEFNYVNLYSDMLDKNLKEKNKKKQWVWEVYELPEGFIKPKIKESNIHNFGMFHQSPIPQILEQIKLKAIRKIF